MRILLWFLLAGSFATMAGCGEFVRTDERTTTTIDVVGEPADPTSNSKEPADILGSVTFAPDDSDSMTETAPSAINVDSRIEESENTNADDDEPGSTLSPGDPKPPRLKTASQKFNDSK